MSDLVDRAVLPMHRRPFAIVVSRTLAGAEPPARDDPRLVQPV
jgi:hypothetical protein